MCCKHNVLISLFCALLLSDVYIAGSPLIKQPLSRGGRQGREARRCAPWFPLGKTEGLAGPRARLAGPCALRARIRRLRLWGFAKRQDLSAPRRQRGGRGRRGEEGEEVSLFREQNGTKAVRVARALSQHLTPPPASPQHHHYPRPC